MYGYLVLAARQNCTRQRFSEFMEDSLRAAKGLIKLGYDLRDEPLNPNPPKEGVGLAP